MPGAEFDAVAVYVGEGDIREEFSHVASPGRDYLRGVALGDLATGPGEHVVEVVLFQDGARVIGRTVSVQVGAPITVATVVITRDCRGVVCPGDGNPLLASCLGGRCADPRCTLETPEFCPEGNCFADAECPLLGCGAPLCVSNVCLYSPDDEACEGSLVCDLDRGCVAAGVDAGSDASTPDAGPDAPTPDSGTDAPMDAGTDVPFDGGPPGCPGPDGDTVFLFDFEGTMDRASALSGEVRGAATLAAGDSPCGGNTLQVTGAEGRWFIADRPEFQRASGSIDFWLRPGAFVPNTLGLVSRDAVARGLPGHLSIYYSFDGRIVVRGQTTTQDFVRCGAALTADTWHRVGLNFGPDRLDLFVDGVRQMGAGTVAIFEGIPVACSTEVGAHSIAGNSNPLIVGSSANASAEGSDAPTSFAAAGWGFDHVRMSSVYRDYAAEL